MSTVVLDMAISLDGFISGPHGEDGGLHDWYFSRGAAEAIKDELLTDIGAMILGHRAFGTAPDGFDTPYHVPHFVLTHQPRPTVTRGGATFVFVTDGIGQALAQATTAAGKRKVCVAGGAETARQFLNAGLIDELQLHVAPVLMMGGKKLFADGGNTPPLRLKRLRVVESAHATHLTFRVLHPVRS